ncbi:MAG: electron transfer flavoprotein subunit alpha/FixB family protein [Desulfobulbaceae bacterium]|nr:electron transfer flavoprotein subunit alpha/FixB family protein [Desulfobulbaceae bacterium]
MAGYRGVLAFIETAEGKVTSTGREMLGVGRLLADALGETLDALLVGSDIEGVGRDVFSFGADRVFLVSDSLLAKYHPDLYTIAVSDACKQILPSIFLLPQDDVGRDIAPRVAAKLEIGLATDCIDLAIDPDTRLLLQTRRVYGGNATEVLVSRNAFPQLVTVKPRAMAQAKTDSNKQGEIITISVKLDASMARSKLLETVKEEIKGIKLEDAKVVVAGGRGIGGPEGFTLIHELAEVLGGAVGASRAPCDEGWVPTSYKIGQTGKVVTPDLYIAIGISGALQHTVGSLGSRCIVAINNDPEAKIFGVSDFKLVADYRDALPALINKYKEIISS